MATIRQARDKLREFKDSINPVIKRTFEQDELIVVDYQTESQLFKGKDSKGFSIKPAYSPITVSIKKGNRQPFDRVTWNDTGDLYRSIKVNASNDEMEITMSVEYSNKLIEMYGDDVLGIQEEFLKDFVNNYILPNIKKEADDKLTRS